MTFRDYAQGAYRMRGIGKGQSVEVLIIPEITKSIKNSMVSCGQSALESIALKEGLCQVLAWLCLNQMRSERIQFHLLCEQNISNLWRKRTFNNMLKDLDELTANISSDVSQSKLNVFRERIDYTVENTVPVDTSFDQKVNRKLREYRDILKDEDIKTLELIFPILHL